MARNPDRGLITQVGPVSVDVPRTAGYFGGIGLAVAVGMIEWPLAVFLGAIPLIKMAQRSNLPGTVRFVAQVFEGASKPVGGDSAGTINLPDTGRTGGETRRASGRRKSAAAATAAGSRRSTGGRTPSATRRPRRPGATRSTTRGRRTAASASATQST
ncbi:MAG: hypothetical protein M3Z13_03955 [Candidatus Dormibacteraeota bacterium]|nr:hypothetical protein [Candidatus Dormibacteraeota bacterium]